ncbi:MAG TPA: histidine kinase [Methylophilaceae bacterium]|nr:histidine kinase [Methylophilaceae bacterium]
MTEPIWAAPREAQQSNNDDNTSQAEIDAQEAAAQQALSGNISMDERLRLRRDLDEYSRSVDPGHIQIEERRRIMRQRIQERFFGSDKDNDGSISREEAFETLPQIARHFNQVDLNADGVITLNELEAAQARAVERLRAAAAKNEAQLQDDDVAKPANNKNRREASNRKRAL